MSFGRRLAEERRRLGFKQAEFAALVGSDSPKQSLYENDHRQLRAAYLARLETAGVDLVYLLTGRRSEGAWLGDDASRLVSDYLALPDELQQAVLNFVRDLERHCAGEP